MDRRIRSRAEGPPSTLGIPLRPELIEFCDAKALCRYTACSKACGKDVRDANAWQLLANVNVQVPRSARDAAENDARSRVRSQVRRRLLADALADASTWDGSQRFEPDRFEDFTFFVRFAEGDQLIWEGDLKASPGADSDLRLPLAQVWTEVKESGTWTQMEDILAHAAGAEDEVVEDLTITLIAIRDADQASVPFGQFCFEDSQMEGILNFIAAPTYKLFDSPTFVLRPEIVLDYSAGDGTLGFLDVEIVQYNKMPDAYIGEINVDSARLILTYLAGVPPVERARALRTIQTWGDEITPG